VKKYIATTDMTSQPPSVLIVGGGIGGLTCALAFAQKGARVCVFEQALEFTEVGAGIQITPNAVRVLDTLGVGKFLPRIGVVSKSVAAVDGLTGKLVSRFDLTKQTPRYHFVHRAKLIDLLAGACMEQGVTLETGRRVVSATKDGRVTFSDIRVGSTPLTEQADLVVFADGINSVGRVFVDGGSEPFFTGQVAWRTIVEGHMPDEAQIAMGPGKHLVIYPLSEDRLNIVAVQERGAWAAEGWSHADDPANLQAAFSDFSPMLRALLAKAEAPNLWGLFRHEVAKRWSNGALVLLGDAAHPTLPFLAQGANLAIEDAFVLARCWGEQRDDFPAAFGRYQALRRDRVIRAIAAANANAKNYHFSGIKRKIALTGLKTLGRVAPNAFLKRLSWLYDHDVTS
jgi:salicylate hydroxylase